MGSLCLRGCLLLLVALVCPRCGAGQGVTARDVAEGIEHHVSLIRDVEMKYTTSWTVDGKLISELGVTWVWCPPSGREFYQRYDYAPTETEADAGVFADHDVAFDGERTRAWYKGESSDGTLRSSKRPNDFPMGPCPKVLISGQALNVMPWQKWARMDGVKLEGAEIVAGRECYVLAGALHYRHSARAWFDPNAGLMLRKCQIFRDGKLFVLYDSIELEQFADGIWLPVKGRIQGTSETGGPSIGRFEVKRSSVKVNQGVPKEFFILKWPQGTRIYDYDLKQNFYVGGRRRGSASRVDSIAEEALREALRPPPDVSSAEEEPEAAGSGWLVAVACGVGVLLLISSLTVLLRRKARRRRACL